MNKDNNVIETNASAITPKEETQVGVSTEIDYEARISALEAEKAKLVETSANYQLAYLKEKGKNKSGSQIIENESEEDRIARLVEEKIAQSRLAQINKEKDELVQRSLKENKELRQALINRSSIIPTSLGTHSEGKVVTDTIVTPEQMAAFKKAGRDDKWIERYKKNLIKHSSRASFF